MSNMSNSDLLKETAQKPDCDATDIEEQESAAEKIKECERLWKNIEAELVVIFHDLIKKWGKPFTDLLKAYLECSICKGVINSAVSRHECFHTFCSDCLTHWAVSSQECPICRNEINLHVKNPMMDKIVNLLVDFTFTEKEKEERNREIQKLSADSTTLYFLDNIHRGNLQEEAVFKELAPEMSLPGRMACAKTADFLFTAIMSEFKIGHFVKGSIPELLLQLHVEMYNSDWDSLDLVYPSIPSSILRASMFK